MSPGHTEQQTVFTTRASPLKLRKDNMMNTKMMTLTFTTILAGGITQAQDWSWTFQRWGDTCGLLFEATNLTTSVKGAIRDDVAKAYAAVTSSNNLSTTVYAPNEPEYGRFVGHDSLEGEEGMPRDLSGWDYKLHNGNRYFFVKESLSTNYLAKIALTNQHQAAIGSLSNFLATANSTTTNNLNVAEYVQMWWSMEQKKPLSLTFSMYKDEVLFFPSEEEVRKFCDYFNGRYEVIVPTILAFKQDAQKYEGVLYCEPVYRKRSDGSYERLPIPLAYCQGKWRLVLPEF